MGVEHATIYSLQGEFNLERTKNEISRLVELYQIDP
jgi:hypothetical protein